MSEGEPLPFWILGSGPKETLPIDVRVKAEGLTAEKLQQLRSALAAFADDPPVTLERYGFQPAHVGGYAVAQGAPILKHLAGIVGPKAAAAARPPAGGETLYRMVVDQRIAGQLAQGLARPMGAADGGIYSAVLGEGGIIANAGSCRRRGGRRRGPRGRWRRRSSRTGRCCSRGSSLCDPGDCRCWCDLHRGARRRALERIESSLKELLQNDLDQEMAAINGAMPALAKATSLLVDEGRLGASLGIDSAAYAIDTAIERAKSRTQRWLQDVSLLSQKATVDQIEKSFPGVKNGDGRFVAELRMAGLAIAAKRRCMVLQAVEHAQLNQGLSLKKIPRRD